jgi:hypothetical protein
MQVLGLSVGSTADARPCDTIGYVVLKTRHLNNAIPQFYDSLDIAVAGMDANG